MMTKHLFILCSHSSGSSALWKFLWTSPNVSAMPVEGQFVDAVKPVMRQAPWDETRTLPWSTIKAEWGKIWDYSQPVLLEKSPPNLLHAFAIERAFDNAYFIVIVRNPYAYCEGTRRRGRSGLGYPSGAPLRRIAAGWIKECQYQIKNVEELKNVIHFTYKEFTENQALIAEKMIRFMPELETLDMSASFLIHSLQGWLDRPVTNLNPAQIARLSTEDITEINSVLKQHPDIMAFWGYEYLEQAYTPVRRLRLKASNLYAQYVTRTGQRFSRRMRKLRPLTGSQ